MASVFISTWYVTALRGVVALCFVLLCLAQARAAFILHSDTFSMYALADGALCSLTVILAKGRRGIRKLALSGAAGLAVGSYLLSTPNTSMAARAIALAIWSLAVSVVALNAGYRLYQSVPSSRRIIGQASGVWRRYSSAMENGLLLAGAVALAFAATVLALSMSGKAVTVVLAGLFAGVFGYLHLRVGLSLGVLALSQEVSAENAGALILLTEHDAPLICAEGDVFTGEAPASST